MVLTNDQARIVLFYTRKGTFMKQVSRRFMIGTHLPQVDTGEGLKPRLREEEAEQFITWLK